MFDPSNIKDADGNLLLSQQLLVKQSPTITGVITDESKNKGDARPIQRGRAYTGDEVDDRLQLPFDLVASDVITNDGAGTLTPDYANDRIDISGQVWNIEIKDSSDVVKALYKCDEQTGTTAYDSSGNGNHAIIQNATLSTFHSTQDVYSFQNEVGYTLGTGSNGAPAGVFIPRDESNTAFDVVGNPLQFTGRVPYNAKAKQSNCVQLNGTNQQIEVPMGTIDNQRFTFFTHFSNLTSTNASTIASIYDTTDSNRIWQFYKRSSPANNSSIGFRLGTTNGSFLGQFSFDGTYDLTVDGSLAITFDTIAGEVRGYYNGVEMPLTDTFTMQTFKSVTQPIMIGARADTYPNATEHMAGKFFNSQLFKAEVLTPAQIQKLHNFESIEIEEDFKLNMVEGSGNIVHDKSGNDNHATLINAPTWAKQDSYHFNLVDGFNKYMRFNGSTNAVSFGDVLSFERTTPFYIEAEFTTTSGGIIAGKYLGGSDTAFRGWFISNTFGPIRFSLLNSTASFINIESVNSFSDGNRHVLRLEYNGSGLASGVTLIVDGVPQSITVVRDDLEGTTVSNHPLVFGSRGALDSSFFTGIIHRVNVNGQSEWINTGNTLADWQDEIGSNNAITIFGSPTNIFIPAINSTTDALGQPLRNPAGAYHNGAETLIDFTNGVLSPEAVINSWEDDWAFNDARTNPEFKRTLTLGGVDHRADKFLAYREELTGSNLTKVNKYVETKEVS